MVTAIFLPFFFFPFLIISYFFEKTRCFFEKIEKFYQNKTAPHN